MAKLLYLHINQLLDVGNSRNGMILVRWLPIPETIPEKGNSWRLFPDNILSSWGINYFLEDQFGLYNHVSSQLLVLSQQMLPGQKQIPELLFSTPDLAPVFISFISFTFFDASKNMVVLF